MMLSRTKSNTHSTAACQRPGTTLALHAVTTMTVSNTTVAMILIRMMRLMANGVPSNRISGGRKSLTEGRCGPASAASSIAVLTEPMLSPPIFLSAVSLAQQNGRI